MTSLFTTLLLLLFLGLPGLVAVRVSGFFFGEAEWWRRGFSAACIYPMFIWAVLMLLAPFALMKVWPVLAAMAVFAALSLLIPARPWRVDEIEQKYLQPWWQVALGAGLVTAVMGVFLYGNYITGTAYMSDDYAYHGHAIAGWFRTGTLEHPRIMFVSYYPFNAHLITLYTLFASGDLRWTWIATLLWLLLGSGAFLVLTRCLPRYTLAWGLLTVAFFLINRLVSWHHFFTLCPADVSGAVVFVSGFVMVIPRKGSAPREALARVTLAAMLIGFAMGSKSTFTLPSVVAGFGLLFITMLGDSPLRFVPRLLYSTGLIAVGAFSTGSYWYLWNWIHARNPVFPARVLDFPGPGHDKHWGEYKLISRIKNAPDSGIWREIWNQSIDLPPTLGILSLLGALACAGFVIWLLWQGIRSRTIKPLGHPMLWLFITGMIMVLQYPFIPYSGSFVMVGEDLWINHRYFFVFYLVGAITAYWGLSSLTEMIRNPMWSRIFGGAAFLLMAYFLWSCFPLNGQAEGNTHSGLARITGLVVSLLIFAFPLMGFRGPFRPSRTLRLIGVGTILVAVLLVGAVRERILPPPYMSVINIEWTRVIPPMIEAIDKLPPGSRIGEYSMNGWESWYLCGSRLQHIPVLLWDKGHEMVPLHEAYYAGMIDDEYPRLGMRREGYMPNPESFADNLREVDLDYMVITKYLVGVLEDRWPIQRPFVQAMPEFELIWTDGDTEIYRRLSDSEVADKMRNQPLPIEEAPSTP